MLSELKKGDDVVTQGGIIGKVTGIKDNELTSAAAGGRAGPRSFAAPSPACTRAHGAAPAKSETKSEAKAS